jgi:hypothetical protein
MSAVTDRMNAAEAALVEARRVMLELGSEPLSHDKVQESKEIIAVFREWADAFEAYLRHCCNEKGIRY